MQTHGAQMLHPFGMQCAVLRSLLSIRSNVSQALLQESTATLNAGTVNSAHNLQVQRT